MDWINFILQIVLILLLGLIALQLFWQSVLLEALLEILRERRDK